MSEEYYHGAEIMVAIWGIAILLSVAILLIEFTFWGFPINGTIPVLLIMGAIFLGPLSGFLFGEFTGDNPPITWLKKM